MPRYDYRCPDGHVTEHVYKMSEMPETTPCPTCAQPSTSVTFAPYINGISQIASTTDPPRNENVVTYKFEAAKCKECGHKTTLFYATDGKTVEEEPCDKCGSWRLEVYPHETPTTEMRFPYFDEHLGVEILSPRHRTQVSQARHLEELSDYDAQNLDSIVGRQKALYRDTERRAAADQREIDTSNKFAKFNAWKDGGGLDAHIQAALADEPDAFTINVHPHLA